MTAANIILTLIFWGLLGILFLAIGYSITMRIFIVLYQKKYCEDDLKLLLDKAIQKAQQKEEHDLWSLVIENTSLKTFLYLIENKYLRYHPLNEAPILCSLLIGGNEHTLKLFYFLYMKPLKYMPLHINDAENDLNIIAKWRLEIGK